MIKAWMFKGYAGGLRIDQGVFWAEQHAFIPAGCSCIPVWIGEKEPDALDAGRGNEHKVAVVMRDMAKDGKTPPVAWIRSPFEFPDGTWFYTADPSTITVPRELLERALYWHLDDGDAARDELRAMLKGAK